jgi:hypothetical protein
MPSWLEVRPLEEVVGTTGPEKVGRGEAVAVVVGGTEVLVETGGSEVDSEPRVTSAVIVVSGRIIVWVIMYWRMMRAAGLGADRRRRVVIMFYNCLLMKTDMVTLACILRCRHLS